MRVLGIDPGLAATGLGIVEESNGRLRCIHHEVVRTDAASSAGTRLALVHTTVTALIHRFRPERAGLEALYFTRNVSSALPVAEARGVILLALDQCGIPASEYAPNVIKQSVVGSGRADKEQVIEMVRVILGMGEAPRPDHAADALAAAITAIHSGTPVGIDVQ